MRVEPGFCLVVEPGSACVWTWTPAKPGEGSPAGRGEDAQGASSAHRRLERRDRLAGVGGQRGWRSALGCWSHAPVVSQRVPVGVWAAGRGVVARRSPWGCAYFRCGDIRGATSVLLPSRQCSGDAGRLDPPRAYGVVSGPTPTRAGGSCVGPCCASRRAPSRRAPGPCPPPTHAVPLRDRG